ncbi:MAG TPA: glycosyltransferase [Rhodothermales bacterium]|nr:glycosyltransferase [Rhodothermales bacterium]
MTTYPESPRAIAEREGMAVQRVFIPGEFYPDSFASHIAETLEAMGCQVMRYAIRPDRGVGTGAFRQRLWMARELLNTTVLQRLPIARRRALERLAAAAVRFAPDIVLFTYDYLLPGEVAELKARTGARFALWYPDAISNLGRMACVAAPFDALFFKDPYMVEVLRDLARGAVHYLPEAYNPARHRLPDGPFDRAPYVCDVATAGSLHVPRFSVFRQLRDYDCKIWGPAPPWWLDVSEVEGMHQRRYVINEEKAVAFTSARVLLNTLYPSEVEGLNVRAFEAAGVGAFQMLDWRPGLADFFEDGRELVSFRGMADLKQKLAYYLARPEERAAIAAAGQARAQREHTYAHRLALLLRILGGEPAPGGEPGADPGAR